MAYFYIAGTIIFTVCGQLVIKWRMNLQNPLPDAIFDKIIFLVKLIFLDPYILGGFFSAFLAALFWMAAMSKLDISTAYPVVIAGLTLLTAMGGVFIIGEAFSLQKIAGILLLLVGVFLLGEKI